MHSQRIGVFSVGLRTESDETAGIKYYSFLTLAHQIEVTFDPKTPARELLPEPPRINAVPPTLVPDLVRVSEVSLEESTGPRKSQWDVSNLIHKINYLNKKKTDGFMHELLSDRTDLAGLPFVMGDACRMKKDHRLRFGIAADSLRLGTQRRAS